MKMETLIKFLDECVLHATRLRDRDLVYNFESQAFGAAQMFARLVPEMATQITELWNEDYRNRFFEIILDIQ